MARKQVLICDSCSVEISAGTGGVLRANFDDGRRGSKVADLCDACMEALPGHPAAKRGRPRAKAEA